MASDAADTRRLRVTEHEGLLLSLVARREPVTGYQLFKMHEQSPLVSVNTSKGQVYPAIRRLKQRELLHSRKAAAGARAEEFYLTDLGNSALREWVCNIGDAHIVLDDPIAARVLLLDVLSREEKLQWIANAKALTKARLSTVEEHEHSSSDVYQEFVRNGALAVLRAKMDWLDDLLYYVASSE